MWRGRRKKPDLYWRKNPKTWRATSWWAPSIRWKKTWIIPSRRRKGPLSWIPRGSVLISNWLRYTSPIKKWKRPKRPWSRQLPQTKNQSRLTWLWEASIRAWGGRMRRKAKLSSSLSLNPKRHAPSFFSGIFTPLWNGGMMRKSNIERRPNWSPRVQCRN